MKSTAIVIPIKTNNQRLPGKNTMLLNGRPLYDYIFQSVKTCDNVDDVFVDSSDETILKIANSEGFKTIRRPIELNSPNTSGNDLIRFELEHISNDVICQVFVTLPFLNPRTIDRSIDMLTSSLDKSSVLALYKEEDRFWFKGNPINHDYSNLEGTQYMSPVYREAGFYTFYREKFLSTGSRVTADWITMEVDKMECVDIDTELDFLYADSVARSGLV